MDKPESLEELFAGNAPLARRLTESASAERGDQHAAGTEMERN
jgi:hypothetical protein